MMSKTRVLALKASEKKTGESCLHLILNIAGECGTPTTVDVFGVKSVEWRNINTILCTIINKASKVL